MAREQEIKLTVGPEAWPEVRAWLAASNAEALPRENLKNTYFDTADARLNKQRIALRIRQSGDSFTQTLKTKGATVRGLHDRQEWDWSLATDQLDVEVLQDSPIAGIVEQGTLQPAFTTDFEREAWLWRERNDVIEVALDRGVVRANAAEVPLSEVELELKAGRAGRLMEQAQALSERCAVFLNPVSKAEQGYWLAGLYEPPHEPPENEHPLDAWLRALGYLWLTGEAGFLNQAEQALAAVQRDEVFRDALGAEQWQRLQLLHSGLVCGRASDVRSQLLSDRVLGQCQLAFVQGQAGQ